MLNITAQTVPLGTTPLTSDLGTAVDGHANAPISDQFSDQRLTSYTEFHVATWIDNVYAPLCSSLGILGNLVSIWVLLTSPRLSGSSTSVYLAALCASDSLVQVVNLLFLVRKFPGHETLRHGTCGLVYFLLYFSLHYSVIVMMGMTLERFLAIRFPLQVGSWCTPKRARVLVVGMCVVTFLINVHHLVIRKMVWNDVLQEDVCSVRAADRLYAHRVWVWVDSTLYCYLPLSSLVLLNVLIVRHMNTAAKFRGSSASVDQNDDVSRQVTLMLLLVTCAFLVLTGPVAVLIVVERYYWVRTSVHEQAVFFLVRTICNNLAYTNHAINFCLYCLGGKRFRRELIRIFCPCLTDKVDVSLKSQQATTNLALSS